MMVWSINILVLAIGILVVGMIKPNWILFWMEKPLRLPIVLISAVLFMTAAVMFGEASKANESLKIEPTKTTINKQDAAPTIAVEPIKESK